MTNILLKATIEIQEMCCYTPSWREDIFEKRTQHNLRVLNSCFRF